MANKKKPAHRRRKVISIRVTDAEYASLHKASGGKLSAWARRKLLGETR